LIQEQKREDILVLGEARKWKARGIMEGVRGLYRSACNMGTAGNEHGRREEMQGCIGNRYESEDGN